MKNYMKCICVAASILLLITGCTSESVHESTSPESQSSDDSYVSSLPDADISIPVSLLGDELADTDATMINESNNDVTYSIKGDDRVNIVNDISDELKTSISIILSDKEYYPNITNITYNSDYTEFIIEISSSDVNTYESMLCMSFYTIGNKYQIYNGIPSDKAVTVVKYVDASSGEVIAQADSTSMKVQ